VKADILVIDDQAGPRESLRMILKQKHNVRVASSGPEGLAMIDEREPDLVFLDVRMPEMDGVDVLAAIKKKHPDVQVAMITAYAAVETAQSAMRLGAMDYITKPFSVPDVEAVVERAMQRHRDRREEQLWELQLQEISAALALGVDLGEDFESLDRSEIMNGLTTAHRSIQSQISQLSRLNALGEIAAEVNHDMNNLLSTILLTIELLLKRLEMGEEVDLAELRNALHTIEAAAQDGSTATSRIREFLKTDPYAPCEMVDLNKVVSSSIQLSSGHVASTQDSCQIQCELPPLPAVFGNEAALRAVFTNILINARQALDAGGQIRITGWQDCDEVVVRVEDNGKGMSPEVLARATEPFFTTKGESGTGLGLSLSQKLVKQHGGRLHIESEEGKGTKVDIHLPVKATQTEDKEQAATVERVLIVDDDERTLRLITRVLKMHGFEVVPVNSGEAAWEEFQARHGTEDEQITMVLTDLDMPEMNGAELAARIKEISPDTPVVLLTGIHDARDVIGDSVEFLNGILHKPFKINDLIDVLRSAGQPAHSAS